MDEQLKQKVLHGLDSCGFYDGVPDICGLTGCPYRGCGAMCSNQLAHDAAMLISEMLEAQEPRLLTVDDFKDNSDVDICGYLPCWVEPNPHGDAATEKLGWGLVSVGQIGGVYHRHWTGKPTQEQMEATPWQ